MFLTPEEIEALTGKVKPSAQRRALEQMGVAFRVRPDGRPVVVREELHARPQKARRASGPDLAALDRLD